MACASIHLLSADEIDEAYVLARLSDAGLTLKAWCRRAAARCASPAVGGVLLARDLDARPCGLLVYALAAQPGGRRSLQIESLVGFALLDPRPIASALIAEVVRLAEAEGCDSLCLIGPLGLSNDVAAQVFATGVAVLPSLFWSPTPVGHQSPPFDPGEERRPTGLAN